MCVFVRSHAYMYSHWKVTHEFEIPLRIGDWIGQEIEVKKDVLDILEADTVLIRFYNKGNDQIWFAVVYYKDNQVGFHTPEACFGGLGNKVFKEKDRKFYIDELKESVVLNQRKYIGNKGDKILYYFYETGDYLTKSYINTRIKMMTEQIKFKKPAVGLFEMYANIIEGNEDDARKKLDDFVQKLIPIVKTEFK